ncbi:MAG: hypothetical protein ACK4ZR_01240 [Aquificaceae bacterium]
MRVRFRIKIVDKEGKRLGKEDFLKSSEPLYIGMRYITEFKYLEATKWLMLAQDCQEKYMLLALINYALGQNSQGDEFFYEARKYPSKTQFKFLVEKPEENISFVIEKPEASLPDFLLSL